MPGSTCVRQHKTDRTSCISQEARQAWRIQGQARDPVNRKGRRRSLIQSAEGLISTGIHRLIVGEIRGVLDTLNTVLTRLIPGNSLRKTSSEIHRALPAPLPSDFGAIDGIAPVVSGPILDELDH